MAKHKQVNFAKLCGIQKSSLPSYIKRNKVVIEDGWIDDSHPVNAAFVSKFQSRAKLEESNISEQSAGEISNTDKNSTKSDIGNPSKKKAKSSSVDFHELEKEKKALDIQKINEEIELLKKRNMKMDGESVPTEIVKNLFSVYGKSIMGAQHAFSENWLTKIAKLKGLSSAEMAEMRGVMIKGLNEIVIKAQAESKKQVANIIKEYSLKREVGEHD